MQISSKDAEILSYEEIMGDEKGSLFVSQYDGKTDLEDYRNSFNMAYTYGETGFTADAVLRNKGVLTDKQASEIYKAAVIQSAAEKQKVIDDINAKYSGNVTVPGSFDDSIIDYSGKDKSKVNWKDLAPRQRSAVKFAKAFSKAAGVNITFVQSTVKNGKRVGKNGSYNPETNTIEIDVYAGIIDAKAVNDAIIPTLSHEMTHWMKAKSPAIYSKMREYVNETLTMDGTPSEVLIDAEMKRMEKVHPGTKATPDMAIDELIARTCEDMLSNSTKAKELLSTLSESEQTSFIDHVKKTFQNIIAWVEDLLGQYKSTSYEAEVLRKYSDRMRELSKMWDQALADAVVTNQSLHNEGIKEQRKDVLQYADRDSGDTSIKDQLKSAESILNAMNPVSKITESRTFNSKQEVKEWVLGEFEKTDYKAMREGFGEIIIDKKRISKGMISVHTRGIICVYGCSECFAEGNRNR